MRLALAVLLALLAAAAPAAAQQGRASFTDVEDEVMCISCNVPLNVAESPQADATRRLIRDLIADGLTKEQIKDELVAQYGANILAEPEDDGFGLAAYLVPVAAAAILLAVLLTLLPRWRRRPASGEAGGAVPGPAVSTADAARLDADMARYDR